MYTYTIIYTHKCIHVVNNGEREHKCNVTNVPTENDNDLIYAANDGT